MTVWFSFCYLAGISKQWFTNISDEYWQWDDNRNRARKHAKGERNITRDRCVRVCERECLRARALMCDIQFDFAVIINKNKLVFRCNFKLPFALIAAFSTEHKLLILSQEISATNRFFMPSPFVIELMGSLVNWCEVSSEHYLVRFPSIFTRPTLCIIRIRIYQRKCKLNTFKTNQCVSVR